MSLFVLYYHRVSVEGDVGVSLGVFERQMRFLSENARVCDLDELCSFLDSGRIPKRPTVAITFDDGFYDTYAFAEPILAKYGLTGTVFVITSRVGEGRPRLTLRDYWEGRCSLDDFPRPSPYSLNMRDTAYPHKEAFMRREELVLCDSGALRVELHGHLHQKFFAWPPKVVGRVPAWPPAGRVWWLRHIYRRPEGKAVFRMESSLSVRRFDIAAPDAEVLGRWPDAIEPERVVRVEGEREQEKRIESEIAEGKRVLEGILARPVVYLCWPWGEYSGPSVEAAKRLGFLACFTTQKGLVGEGTDPLAIPRISARKGFYKFVRRFFFCCSPVLFNAARRLGVSF